MVALYDTEYPKIQSYALMLALVTWLFTIVVGVESPFLYPISAPKDWHDIVLYPVTFHAKDVYVPKLMLIDVPFPVSPT